MEVQAAVQSTAVIMLLSINAGEPHRVRFPLWRAPPSNGCAHQGFWGSEPFQGRRFGKCLRELSNVLVWVLANSKMELTGFPLITPRPVFLSSLCSKKKCWGNPADPVKKRGKTERKKIPTDNIHQTALIFITTDPARTSGGQERCNSLAVQTHCVLFGQRRVADLIYEASQSHELAWRPTAGGRGRCQMAIGRCR